MSFRPPRTEETYRLMTEHVTNQELLRLQQSKALLAPFDTHLYNFTKKPEFPTEASDFIRPTSFPTDDSRQVPFTKLGMPPSPANSKMEVMTTCEFIVRSRKYIQTLHDEIFRTHGDETAQRYLRRTLELIEGCYMISTKRTIIDSCERMGLNIPPEIAHILYGFAGPDRLQPLTADEKYLRPKTMHITIVVNNYKGHSQQSMVASIRNDNCLGTVRHELAKYFDTSYELLKMMTKGRVLYAKDWDDVLLSHANLGDMPRITVDLLKPGDPDADLEKIFEEKFEKTAEVYANSWFNDRGKFQHFLDTVWELDLEDVWEVVELRQFIALGDQIWQQHRVSCLISAYRRISKEEWDSHNFEDKMASVLECLSPMRYSMLKENVTKIENPKIDGIMKKKKKSRGANQAKKRRERRRRAKG